MAQWPQTLGRLVALLVLSQIRSVDGIQRQGLVQLGLAAPPPGAPPGTTASDLEEVHVVYAVDLNKGIKEGLLASLVSLSQHLEDPERCTIHLIAPKEKLSELRQLAGCSAGLVGGADMPKFVFHEFQPLPQAISDYVGKSESGHRTDLATPAALVRLYLQDYLPSVPRAVWIDYDTIVQADVGSLYRAEMTHGIAAAFDHSSILEYLLYTVPRDSDVIRGLRHPLTNFFNSGVMVMDLDRWRSENYSRKIEEVAASMPVHKGEDQLLMNIYFQDEFDVLDKRWNTMNLGDNDHLPTASLDNAWILHWSGCHKAWKPDGFYKERWAPYDFRGQCNVPKEGEETFSECTSQAPPGSS